LSASALDGRSRELALLAVRALSLAEGRCHGRPAAHPKPRAENINFNRENNYIAHRKSREVNSMRYIFHTGVCIYISFYIDFPIALRLRQGWMFIIFLFGPQNLILGNNLSKL